MKGEFILISFKQYIDKINQQKLALFSIRSHTDKKLLEDINPSAYEITIQAGAALTDERLFELNDYDDFNESISDRNQRYGGLTAVYWIRKNISSEYIGISYYNKKWLVSDAMLDEFMASDEYDVILAKQNRYAQSIEKVFKGSHYSKDWDIMLDVLKEKSPDYYERAKEIFEQPHLYPECMGIYKKEVFEEMCDWLFPILDELYNQLNEKTDIYQKADVGFFGELLMSLFFDVNKEKYKYKEMSVIKLAIDEVYSIDLKNEEELLKRLNAMGREMNITGVSRFIDEFYPKISNNNQQINHIKWLIDTWESEKRGFPLTLFEYLPEGKDWDKALSKFEEFIQKMKDLNNGVKGAAEELCNFIKMNNWNDVVLLVLVKRLNITNTAILNGFGLSLLDKGLPDHAFQMFRNALEIEPGNDNTLLNLVYYYVQDGNYKFARNYLDSVADQKSDMVRNFRIIIEEKLRE